MLISNRFCRQIAAWIVYIILGFSLVICWGKVLSLQAQTLRPQEVAAQVYQKLPELPRENQYINQNTNQVDEDNTLMNRFISYHQYVKNRPTKFRLDWKLTLADYLGAHETILAERYPGYQTLTTNPLAGDLEVIRGLNLRQRNELVAVLMSIYNPETPIPPKEPESNPETQSEPNLNLPQPGDAELLLP